MYRFELRARNEQGVEYWVEVIPCDCNWVIRDSEGYEDLITDVNDAERQAFWKFHDTVGIIGTNEIPT